MLSDPRIGRRAAVGGVLVGAAAIGLGGCETGTSRGPEEHAGATSPPSAADPDVASALVAIAAAADVVRAQRRAFPRLRGELRGWERLHVQHARALGGSASRGAGAPAADVAAARSAVTSAETRLRRVLLQGSATADDGTVALLLGSMAAAVAQRQAAT